MLAKDHTRAARQASNHMQLAAELLTGSKRRGYEQAPNFYLSSQELADYDIGRAMRAVLDPVRYSAQAGLEATITSRAMQSGASRVGAGMFVPFSVLQRDLSAGVATAGGHLSGTKMSEAASWLRPVSACAAAGATFITGLNEPLSLPRFAGGSEAAIVGENVAGPEANPTYEVVTLKPKTITVYVDYSRRLGLQTNNDISAVISADLAGAVGQVIDRMAINGSGVSNEPLGILNTPGVGNLAIGTNGGAVTWDKLVDLEYQVANENAAIGAMGYVSTPEVQRQLRKLPVFAGGDTAIWARDAEGDNIGGVPAWASNNAPKTLVKGTSSNCSAVIYGNWSDLVVGIWGGGIEILVDKITNMANGGTRLVVHIDVDVAVRRPKSFSAIRDAVA